MTSGTTSLSARPTSRALRDSGATSVRSCEPVCISKSRFAPVEAVPNRATITRMPGTNHCSVPATSPPEAPMSSGPNRPRKTSGCTSEKITLNGSRTSGRDSRANTVAVSCTKPVGRADAADRSVTETVEAAGLIVFMSVLLLRIWVRARGQEGRATRAWEFGCRYGGHRAMRVGLGRVGAAARGLLAEAPAREREEHVVERGLPVGGRDDVEAGVAELADPPGEARSPPSGASP